MEYCWTVMMTSWARWRGWQLVTSSSSSSSSSRVLAPLRGGQRPRPRPRLLPIVSVRPFNNSSTSKPSPSSPPSSSSSRHHHHVCSECGASHSKWSGRCTQCGEWNTLTQVRKPLAATAAASTAAAASKHRAGWLTESRGEPAMLGTIKSSAVRRITFPDKELCRVLGGGLVPGSLTLLGGEPGIGKSTLAMQLAAALASSSSSSSSSSVVLYVSGEETPEQLKMRADRLGIHGDVASRIALWDETNVEAIGAAVAEQQPAALIVDSIQTAFTTDTASSVGSLAQIRESATRLLRIAKSSRVPVIILGHVTKTGDIAGPKALEHTVDTVLYFEGDGFRHERTLQVIKNRFGSVDEMTAYEMTDRGLVAIANYGLHFVQSSKNVPVGSALTMSMQGTRAVTLEVQALATESFNEFAPPRRRVVSIDTDRFHILLSVLQKHVRLPVYKYDIVVSVAGGIKLKEPASDLAVCAAIVSSVRNASIGDTLFVGEVSLSGELRPVPFLSRRLEEARMLGFKRCVVPLMSARALSEDIRTSMDVVGARHIGDVMRNIKGPPGANSSGSGGGGDDASDHDTNSL